MAASAGDLRRWRDRGRAAIKVSSYRPSHQISSGSNITSEGYGDFRIFRLICCHFAVSCAGQEGFAWRELSHAVNFSDKTFGSDQ